MINTIVMEQTKKPVNQYYYSDKEWNRLGCGPLPKERDLAQQTEKVIADGKTIKGNN